MLTCWTETIRNISMASTVNLRTWYYCKGADQNIYTEVNYVFLGLPTIGSNIFS